MFKEQKGQTLIETALILFLLLVILLGITEFSRAWFLKNSFKNAVRQGARVAAVTSNSLLPIAPFSCTSATPCPNTDTIVNAICCQPSVRPATGKPPVIVTLTCESAPVATPPTPSVPISCDTVAANDAIEVRLEYTDDTFFIVGGGMWPWSRRLTFENNADPALDSSIKASMRYE